MKLLLVLLFCFSVIAGDCKKGYLCGTGCGLHEAEADGAARAQIGKMFKVKVTSTFTSARANFGELDESYVHEVIDEYVEENLEGITIEDRTEEDGEICATAVLNKINFSENIKNKIRALNKQSKELVNSGNNLIWEQVRSNNSKVKQLGSVLSVVEVDSISKTIPIPVLKSKPINLKYETSGEVELFKEFVTSRIIRNGYKKASTGPKLIVSIDLEKLPLKISGFEKYRLTMSMKAYEKKKEISKSFLKLTATGRNQDQVIEKLFKEFKDKVPQQFIDLKI